MANDETWFEELRANRQWWVDASHANNFDRGIWNATVEKYADPVHFIFELMQNAEDERASSAILTIGKDAIVFEHNGDPFDWPDVDGITGIGNTTKLDEPNKIGCFGIGFKSVYVISDRPEVHTWIDGRPFAFAITDLVVPVAIPHQAREGWTRIVLPFRDGIDVASARLRDAMREIGPRSMLFLDFLKSLSWSDGTDSEQYVIEETENGERTLRRSVSGGAPEVERYLVLARPIEGADAKSVLAVKIALRLNLAGDVVRTAAPTRLAVFFETEESTGLYFHLHGPFKLTDNRANIKRGDEWNDRLIDELGKLFADNLPAIRDRGLLKRNFLDVLPNGNDGLSEPWTHLHQRLVAAFKTGDLVPAHFGGHLPAAALVRGPADLRDLLGDDGLQKVSGKTDARWSVSGSLRNNREDAFLANLEIPEWGLADFQKTFATGLAYPAYAPSKQLEAWFDALPDDKVQRVYLTLEAATKLAKASGINHVPFIRLENGSRVTPTTARLPPAGEAVEDEVGADVLPLVKGSLVRGGRGKGKEVLQFLQRLGVREVSEGDYIKAILASLYPKNARSGVTVERHQRHLRRFLNWWRVTKDTAPFRGSAFLRAEGSEGYFAPAMLYIDAPVETTGLAIVYDSNVPGRARRPIASSYARLKRNDLLEFLVALEVENRLKVRRTLVTRANPHFSALKQGFGGARSTSTGHDRDYVIDDLTALLARRLPAVSALVWATMRIEGPSVLHASYTPNQQWEPHKHPSTLATVLSTAEWIPARDGTLRRPSAMTAADLAPGFSTGGNEAWLHAIGFAADDRRRSEQHQSRRKAAEALGLSAAFADALADVPADQRDTLLDDLLQRLRHRPAQQPEFPQRPSSNPERRATRLAERTQEAAAKTYDTRERSVRVSDGEVQRTARVYLRDLYTNEAGEMVCQACHDEMPFRLADGRPFFEAVEYLWTETREIPENHLALCPTCAAKWRHANEETPEGLTTATLEAVEPHISPTLAGQAVQLRFVEVHLRDLQTVLSPAPGDAVPDLADALTPS